MQNSSTKAETHSSASMTQNCLLAAGQLVCLDRGFTNQSIVEVVSQTPNRLITIVKSGDVQWQVMTYRLSLMPCC